MAYMQAPDGFVLETTTPEIYKDFKRLTKAAGKAARAEYCKAELRKLLQPGDTVHCVLRNVSRSGMQRRIDFYKTIDGDLRYLSSFIADALGMRMHDKGGIVVDGCGMDTGFHVVYCLGYSLWPKGTDKPHGTRNGRPDSDGGYALKHSWI
jgi:hypothetical protein